MDRMQFYNLADNPDTGIRSANEAMDNTVMLSPQTGAGYVKNVVLETNCQLRYYNFTLKKEVAFELFTPDEEQATVYKLLFNLESYTTSPDNDFQTLLYSNNSNTKGLVKRNVPFKRVAILFNAEWLNENFGAVTGRIQEMIQLLSSMNRSTVISEKTAVNMHVFISRLAIHLDEPTIPMLPVKALGYILLNDFLTKLHEQDRSDVRSDQTTHYHTMLKVGERVMQFLNQRLPCLQQLAAEFNLSVSTLKRHFKIVFGKNIYQYYQEKRMEWGRTQLENGYHNVNEIATQLGFYKINNFSKAFRKHFGVLPREFKHKMYATKRAYLHKSPGIAYPA